MVPLQESYLLQGKDQEIERYVKDEIKASIPAIQDREQVRLILNPAGANVREILPFYRNAAGVLENNYLAAGFNDAQIKSMTQALSRSIYIFDLYDTDDPDKRKLLARSFAKADDKALYVPTGNTPSIQFVQGSTPTPLSYLSLPAYFLSKKPTGTVYLQISFFNSAIGRRVMLRLSQTTSTFNAAGYVPLVYDATARAYTLPTGTSLNMEEIPVALTSAAAEAERLKRNKNMEREFEHGEYRPATVELLPNATVKFPPVSY